MANEKNEEPIDPKRLELALKRLPKIQRMVIEEIYFKGMPREQVARQLCMTKSRFDKTLSMAYRKLRRYLNGARIPSVRYTPDSLYNDESVDLVIEWEPDLVSPDHYARLVNALGDLIRAGGGQGIERVRSQGVGINIPCDAGVPR